MTNDKNLADAALHSYFDDLLETRSDGKPQGKPSQPLSSKESEPEPDNQTDASAPRGMLKNSVPEPASPVEPKVASKPVARPQSQVDLEDHRAKVEKLLQSQPAPVIDTVTQVAQEVEVDQVEAVVPTVEAAPPSWEWLDNGRPAWAQDGFDVLLFDVAGLTLAVPLVALGQIYPMGEELTPLFGQADWFMGLLPTSAGKIRTVNTALFVMPERYRPEFTDAYKYVITIDGVPWGLAVDGVNQPITLSPDDVKWRTARTQRPWLAGTVKQHMCVLLDIPQMGHLLDQADSNQGNGNQTDEAG